MTDRAEVSFGIYNKIFLTCAKNKGFKAINDCFESDYVYIQFFLF